MANQTAELDELDLLSNPDEVRKAELESSRPRNLPVFIDITCDIANDELRKYTASGDYGEYEAVNLRLTNIEVHRCVEGKIFTDDEFNLEIRVPKKANSNSPITLMVAAAMKVDPKINSIRMFPGLKKVHLVEKVHLWKMREKAVDEFGEDLKEIDENGKEKQVYTERPVLTRYYAIVGMGARSSPNAKAAKAVESVTDEEKAAALSIIQGKDESTILETAFNKAAQKDPVLSQVIEKLADGSILAELIAEGKVLRDGEHLVAP